MANKNTIEFIKSKLMPLDNGCLVWPGCGFRNNNYACVRFEGKYRAGHRIIYEDAYGPIPQKMVVMHLCDNPKCMNIDHLKMGTQKENIRDAVNKKRMFNQKKTHCPRGHEYNEKNTYIQKKGSRFCRSCAREKFHERLISN